MPAPVRGAASAPDAGFAPPPSPATAFAPTAPAGPTPTLPPVAATVPTQRSGDGSTMDLGLYARLIWRFKWVMALGLFIGIVGAYLLYEGGGGAYQSRAQVFITQAGFTWGSTSNVPSNSANGSSSAGSGSSSAGSGSSSIIFPYVPGVDPQRLAALATLYAQLANGSALRTMLPAVYQSMLNPTSGSPTATLSPNAVTASEFANPATLPLVTFWATAPTPALATGLASAATAAFQRLVTAQQAAVSSQSQIVAQVVQTATPAVQSGHKSKSLPIMVFLGGFLGAFFLSLTLENTRPRSAGPERNRKLGDRKLGRRKRGPSGESPAANVAAADSRAHDLSLAESGV